VRASFRCEQFFLDRRFQVRGVVHEPKYFTFDFAKSKIFSISWSVDPPPRTCTPHLRTDRRRDFLLSSRSIFWDDPLKCKIFWIRPPQMLQFRIFSTSPFPFLQSNRKCFGREQSNTKYFRFNCAFDCVQASLRTCTFFPGTLFLPTLHGPHDHLHTTISFIVLRPSPNYALHNLL
jgi:hypothetical protein